MAYLSKRLCITVVAYILISTPWAYSQESEDEILKYLQDFDSVYRSGFTISGTYIEEGVSVGIGASARVDLKKEWKITTSNEMMAYEEEVVEVLKLDRVRFLPLRSTWLFGPKAQAKYDFVGRVYKVGKLPPWPEDSPGPATGGSLDIDHPDAPTYKFPIKKMLWSLGRGYSEHITHITKVSRLENGLLSIAAEGTDISNRPGATWELVIDPKAGYMVRQAKLYRREKDTTPYVSIANSGTKWIGSCCVPEQTELSAPFAPRRTTDHLPETASDRADEEFLRQAERTMERPYLVHTDVSDQRMSPELNLAYGAGALFPRGRRGQEEAILFEALESAPPGAAQEETDAVREQGQGPRQNNKPEDVSSNGDVSSAQAESPDSKSSAPPGNITTGPATKRVIAWAILGSALAVGVAYLSFRIYTR